MRTRLCPRTTADLTQASSILVSTISNIEQHSQHIAPQGKNYAFLEFRSVEEASNCMAFDGVVFDNAYLRVSDAL